MNTPCIIHSSRAGGCSSRGICLSRFSCPLNNSKLSWYLESQCHHSCGYAKPRQSDLKVKINSVFIKWATVIMVLG